jgi:hypothetical protein
LLMFGERDAAEQEGVGFCPGVLSAFRASEFGFALALHFHALAGGGGLPVELKSAGCQTGVGFCIGAGGDDVMAICWPVSLPPGSPVLKGCSLISFIFAAQIVWYDNSIIGNESARPCGCRFPIRGGGGRKRRHRLGIESASSHPSFWPANSCSSLCAVASAIPESTLSSSR